MELIKQNWNKSDIKPFLSFLQSLAQSKEKQNWEQRIVQTQKPCLAIKSKQINDICKEISKGNYISFINLWMQTYHQNIIINGNLICKIKEFDVFKIYLDKYATTCDNWASTDTLKFSIDKNNREQFFSLAKEYIKDKLPFKRRIGIIILFKFLNDDYINQVFTLLDGFKNEQHYYANMANAWLLCECFIKQREKTIAYLKKHNLNKFTINKAISKCRDSFRVSKEDKEMLLSFKM